MDQPVLELDKNFNPKLDKSLDLLMSAYKTKAQPDRSQLKPCKVKPYNEVEAELIKLRKLETDLECQMQANQYVVDAYNKQFDKIDKKF